MSIVMPLGLLLVLIAAFVAICRLTRSKKQFILFSFSSFLLLCGILFAVYFPTCQWYSFSFSDFVESGENDIDFTVPFTDKAHGHYTLSLTPVDHTNAVSTLSGFFESGGKRHSWFSRSAQAHEGKAANIQKLNQNGSVATGLTIENRIRQDGRMHVIIEDVDPPNRYRLSVGRAFP